MASEITTEERPQSVGHIYALDGLRGFAVLLVFAYHLFGGIIVPNSLLTTVLDRIVRSGWIGVDLFFVLSGFLISTILLDARNAHNYYKVFYIRRGLRIFPLYYLVLGGALLLEPGHYPWTAQIFYWLNLSNLPTAFYPMLIGYLAHFWSLGIEEQFYMVWPTVVRRITPKALAYLCLGVIGGLFLIRLLPVWIRLSYRYPDLLYRLTPFRIDTLCGGALLAVMVKYRRKLMEENRVLLRVAFLGAFALFLFCGVSYTDHRVIRLGYTCLVISFTSLVALALFPGGWISRIFSNGFLRQMGKYSYSFYLFHPFVVNFFATNRSYIQRGMHPTGPYLMSVSMATLLACPVEFIVILALSALTWRIFEGPILKYKKHFRYAPRPEHYLA
jgi:peptidoglycan/LPS O-acetylase OafA/YrhL